MSRPASSSRWRRPLGLALLWTLALLVLAGLANVAGLYLLGSLDAWRRWLQAASHYLLVWRLCLYAMAGYGWWRMRRQLLAREPGADAGRRLLRAEIGALVAIAALEISLLRQAM